MDRAEVLRHAAACANARGEESRSVALIREALAELDEAADPLRAAALYERLGNFLRAAGLGDESFAAFDRALALLPPEPSAQRAHVLETRARVLMLRDEYGAAREAARRALEEARAVGAEQTELRALNTLGFASAGLGDEDEGIAMLQRGAAPLAGRRHARRPRARGDQPRRAARLRRPARRGARRRARRGGGRRRPPRALQLRRVPAPPGGQPAQPHGPAGGGAREAAAAACRARPISYTQQFWRSMRARLALLSGDLDGLRAELEATERLVDANREPQWLEPYALNRAELALREDRLESRAVDAAARRDAARALRRGQPAAAARGDGRARRGRGRRPRPRARRGLRAGARRRHRGAGGPRLGPAALRRGVRVGRDAQGGARAPPLPARRGAAQPGQVARGRGGLRRDHLPGARDLRALPRGRGVRGRRRPRGAPASRCARRVRRPRTRRARSCSAPTSPRSRAARGSTSTPSTPSRSRRARTSPAARLGLTPRELEVLLLVAEGRTNRAIGEVLFMSEKTASVHVSRILAKLGVGGRVEAAAVAHRLGLTSPARVSTRGGAVVRRRTNVRLPSPRRSPTIHGVDGRATALISSAWSRRDRADDLLVPLRRTTPAIPRSRCSSSAARADDRPRFLAPVEQRHRRAPVAQRDLAGSLPERYRDEADALRFEQRMMPLGGVHQGTSTDDLVDGRPQRRPGRRLRALVAGQRARAHAAARPARRRRGPARRAQDPGPDPRRDRRLRARSRPAVHRLARRRRRPLRGRPPRRVADRIRTPARFARARGRTPGASPPTVWDVHLADPEAPAP